MSKNVSFKEINRLALPAILAGIVEPVISITDTAIAGRLTYDTIEALAGVGLVGAFLSTLIWIFAQTRSAVSAYVSQAYGANKINSICPLFSQIFYMNLIISILILIGSYMFAQKIFELYSAKGLTLDYCISYYTIRAWGYPFTLLTFTIFGAFRGMQNTFWTMTISLIGCILNVVLDYLFAIHWDMHVQGIAYASLISQGVMFILAIIYLFIKTPFRLKIYKRTHPLFKKALYMTFNLISRAISLNIALFLANRYATSYGDKYIDTQSILMQIWLLSAFILDGYSNAGNAIAGRLFGEKNLKQLWNLAIILIKRIMIISLVLMVIYLCIYKHIPMWFAPQQTEIAELFKDVFWIVIIMQPINAIAFIFDGMYKGMGMAKFLRNLLFIATFIGFIPTIMLVDIMGGKLYAIWAAFFVWMLIRGGGLMWSFYKSNHPKYIAEI